VYGAWPGARNRFTIHTLLWKEATDLFDSFCFAECQEHSLGQVRKLTARLIGEVKRKLPAPDPTVSAVLAGTASRKGMKSFIARLASRE
jgi:hypothetical protein